MSASSAPTNPAAALHAGVFAVADRPVRVANVEPNALVRHEYGDCARSNSWRPELSVPVVSFVATTLLTPPERLRYVSIFDRNANLSRDVRIGLKPGEFAVAIDPSVVILYDRTKANYYCLTVTEQDEIRVNLDLTNIVEGDHL